MVDSTLLSFFFPPFFVFREVALSALSQFNLVPPDFQRGGGHTCLRPIPPFASFAGVLFFLSFCSGLYFEDHGPRWFRVLF